MKQSPLTTILIVLCIILFVIFSLATALVAGAAEYYQPHADQLTTLKHCRNHTCASAISDATLDQIHGLHNRHWYNLELSTATYLGGAEADSINAIDVASDGSVIVGGVMPVLATQDVTATTVLDGGSGILLRTDGTGHAILAATRLGNVIDDLEINSAGQLVACGDFGAALLNEDAINLRWHVQPGRGQRCTLGLDGTVAVLVDNAIHVHAPDSTPSITLTMAAGTITDIALAGSEGVLIATGFIQSTPTLQSAFLRGWDLEGNALWTGYGFTPILDLDADTRGQRVAIGRDGLLYLAATINGGAGASIFARDPLEAARSAGDRTVLYDRYTNPYALGTTTTTWYGRYDPQTGALLRGQSLLTRQSNGRGNWIIPKDIMADEDGQVYLVGSKAADLENRTARQVGGQLVGEYEEGEGFFLLVSADFTERLIWTPFARSGYRAGDSPATAVSVRNGTAAIALTQANLADGEPSRRLITHNQPLHPDPTGGASDGYLAIWPRVDLKSAPGMAPADILVATSLTLVGANTFVAHVEPVDTVELPLTFTWKVNGVIQHIATDVYHTTNEFIYIWPGPRASQFLTVEVSNSRGLVFATYLFDVIEGKRVFLPILMR